MSNRPTPETDAARHDLSDYGPPVLCSLGDWVPFEVAEQLERERDEAREELSLKQQTLTIAEGTLSDLRKQRDELLNEIKRLRLDAQREAEQHDRMVKELEGLYDKLKS